MCQGLLSCRRHIGKREDPGDEVEVHCTNKTLHNESQKNVTVHLGPRVTCEKNMTACHDCLFWSVCFVKEREINKIKTTRLSFLADSFTLH